jgi:thymidylate synthase (FAD)
MILPEIQDFNGFPAIHPPVLHTPNGTPYLQHPGVVMISKPDVNIQGLRPFLEGFAPELGFTSYLDDPTILPPAEQLVKVAGQICYASFSDRRTHNANAQGYFNNILGSGHGSVLEHANFSLFFYGVSRSTTHELVRHRAGTGFSQLSQRYVSGAVLRFVERPEYIGIPLLHDRFERRVDTASRDYAEISEVLLRLQNADERILSAERKTDLRKKVQQAARSVLPNETETFLVVTGNMRAWRHILTMRASEHAETEIREMAMGAFRCLQAVTPMLLDDFTVKDYIDGTQVVEPRYPKV